MDILGGSQTILSPENDSKYMNAYFVLLNINCIEETALVLGKKNQSFQPEQFNVWVVSAVSAFLPLKHYEAAFQSNDSREQYNE